MSEIISDLVKKLHTSFEVEIEQAVLLQVKDLVEKGVLDLYIEGPSLSPKEPRPVGTPPPKEIKFVGAVGLKLNPSYGLLPPSEGNHWVSGTSKALQGYISELKLKLEEAVFRAAEAESKFYSLQKKLEDIHLEAAGFSKKS